MERKRESLRTRCLNGHLSSAASIVLSLWFSLSGLAAVTEDAVVLWFFYKSESLRTISNRFFIISFCHQYPTNSSMPLKTVTTHSSFTISRDWEQVQCQSEFLINRPRILTAEINHHIFKFQVILRFLLVIRAY